ncbi:MAG: PQQ-binding-like beta-propeller repeat protein [Acidobacteriota bacterium]
MLLRQLSLPLALLFSVALCIPAHADWTHWRGPQQTGVVDAEDLIATWSLDGDNLLWRGDFTGRSTPVVLGDRVCAVGRVGEDITRQEVVACWNAADGTPLWQQAFNVYLTTVPWNRVGWGSPAGDAETGMIYAQLVDGRFVALAADGTVAWQRRLGEDFGRFSGYGGRTNTPVVDGDRVITHVISASWGTNRGPRDRWVAFDKRSGEIVWVARGEGSLKDLNTYASPVIAEIDGRRQLVAGGADGWVYGFDAYTGESIWRYHLSQRGLNSSPVVAGNTVYISHSEENVDAGVMGRVVALDVAGAQGVLPRSAERWHIDQLQAGFVSPIVHDGVVYVGDNSANLHALETDSGEELWELNYGTVGKGSPVLANGRIYITEVNGNMLVLEGGDEPKKLAEVHIEMPSGRYAEIYGSPAISDGRIFFTTEEGIYALGKSATASSESTASTQSDLPRFRGDGPLAANAKPASLRVVPAVHSGMVDESVDFDVFAFDAQGRPIGHVDDVTWALEGVGGTIGADGMARFAGDAGGPAFGSVRAAARGLEAVADVRIFGPLPWSFDFEAVADDKPPSGWLGVGKGAKVRDEAAAEDAAAGASKILVQPKAPRGAPRATMYFGPSSMSSYTLQVDARGNREGRRLTDLGIVNNGYLVDLQGAHQRIQVSSWASERRMMQQFPFEWEMDVWYTLKSRVDLVGEGAERKAVIRGKVWRTGEPEPADWTVTVEDPLPIETGAPALYTFAPVEAYFDNVRVTSSAPLAPAPAR